MEKQVIIYDSLVGKKHSVRYDTSQENPAISSIYVMRTCLGASVPTKLKLTLEEVKA